MIQQLRAQLETSETIIAELKQEKLDMGADFEYKRSKIKDLYFAKESKMIKFDWNTINMGHASTSNDKNKPTVVLRTVGIYTAV